MEVRELDGTPRLPVLFGKAAVTAPRRGGGSATAALPDTRYTRHRVAVDTAELADYDRVCGFRLSDVLPATYPHLLTFPMAAKLMTDAEFPFALAGLVHVRNAITVHRPLRVTDPLDLAVHAADLRQHPKGRQFDVVSRAYVAGELAWEDVSTYLRRGSGGSGSSDGSGDSDRSRERGAAPEPDAVWRVAGDTGRRYARVSGDANPIHLHPLTARLLGFPKAIAHGMWTKARSLAALEGRLPETYTVDVRFQAPLLLPAKVGFSSTVRGGETQFAVHGMRNGKPHLRGSVTRL